MEGRRHYMVLGSQVGEIRDQSQDQRKVSKMTKKGKAERAMAAMVSLVWAWMTKRLKPIAA